jgi:hypothetical protein
VEPRHDSDGWRERSRLSVRRSRTHARGRLLRAGVAQRLHAVSPRRRSRHLGARRPVGRTALGDFAGQPGE